MAHETGSDSRQAALDRLRDALDDAPGLPQADRDVLRLRFGLHDGVPRDRDETADLLRCSVESVRKSELRALETLGLSDLAGLAPGRRRYPSLPDGTPALGVVLVGGVRWWRLRDGRWTDGERTLLWWDVYPALGEVSRRSPFGQYSDGALMLDAAFVRRDPMMLAEVTARLAKCYVWAGVELRQAQDNAAGDVDDLLTRRAVGPGVIDRVATEMCVSPATVIRCLGLSVRQPSDAEQEWDLDGRNGSRARALTIQVDHLLTRPMLVQALARHLRGLPERRDRRALERLCASITRAQVVAACRAALLAHDLGRPDPAALRVSAASAPGTIAAEAERADTDELAGATVERLWPRPRFPRAL